MFGTILVIIIANNTVLNILKTMIWSMIKV